MHPIPSPKTQVQTQMSLCKRKDAAAASASKDDPAHDAALAPLLQVSQAALDACRPHWPDPVSTTSTGGLALSDIAKDGGTALASNPSGIVRLPDGMVHISVVVPFPGVTPAMLEWWVGTFCEDSVRYKLWHPLDHKWCAWDKAYSATPPLQRPPNHHIGKRWAVRETVGGQLKHYILHYQDPQQTYGLPDAAALKATTGIGVILASRIYEPDALRGQMGVAHEFNCLTANPTTGETELRCHFWLGDVAIAEGGSGLLPPSIVERVGNHPWGRKAFAPFGLARAVHRHCFEEMSCLAAVLPEAYKRFKDASYVPSASSV